MTTSGGRYRVLLIGICLCLCGPASSQDAVAVLSSELKPYVEAYEAFREALGYPVPVVSLSAGQPRIREQTRAVVAFGSKAAQQRYTADAVLIYCMAPATVPVERRRGSAVRISMLPHPDALASGLQKIQPSLRRLAVYWQMEGYGDYIRRFGEAAARLDIEVIDTRLTAAGLPPRLRELIEIGVDALWLPPDPLLIDAQTFTVLREFSRANQVPFYAPTTGFVVEGAVASVSVSYAQVGREAAALMTRVLAGEAVPAEVFLTDCEITLNLEAAAVSGLRIPESVVREAARVVP